MREFTKSMMRFTWSMTVFGTKQMVDLFRSQGRGDKLHDTAEAFDHVTNAAESEMEDITKSVFQMGDNLQKNMVDMMFGMTPFRNSGQGNLDGMMSNMVRQSADTMRKGVNFMQQSASTISNAVQDAGAPSETATPGWGPTQAGSGRTEPHSQPPPRTDSASSKGVGWGPMPTQSSDPKTRK